MSTTAVVEDVKIIVVNAVVIICGLMGIWTTFRVATTWNLVQAFLGPLLILLCILGGVVKKFQWGGGRFSVETHESPFMSWRRALNQGLEGRWAGQGA